MVKRALVGLAAAVILAATPPLLAQERPSATFELSAGAFEPGVGYAWSAGTPADFDGFYAEADLLPNAALRDLENGRGVVIRLDPLSTPEQLSSLLGMQISLERRP